MYIFPKDEHLETRRVPNKPQLGPTPVAPIIIKSTVISVAVSVPITLTLFGFEPQFNTDLTFPEQITFETRPNPNRQTEREINPSDSTDEQNVPPSTQVLVSYSQNRIEISRCNGIDVEGANFRDYPSLKALAIKGVVRAGQAVFLTGATTQQDGLVWYEAVNESELALSVETEAQNQTAPNQLGWIAACFVG